MRIIKLYNKNNIKKYYVNKQWSKAKKKNKIKLIEST